MLPKSRNTLRQPQSPISAAVATGVRLPASRDPECVMPCAKPRSDEGSQREKARVALGNPPASPTPNRKRIAIMDAPFQAAAVKAVKADHQSTIPVSVRLGPTRSTSQPAGTWKSPYPHPNRLKISPTVK